MVVEAPPKSVASRAQTGCGFAIIFLALAMLGFCFLPETAPADKPPARPSVPVKFDGVYLAGGPREAKLSGFSKCSVDYHQIICARSPAVLFGVEANRAEVSMDWEFFLEDEDSDLREKRKARRKPEEARYSEVKFAFEPTSEKLEQALVRRGCVRSEWRSTTSFHCPGASFVVMTQFFNSSEGEVMISAADPAEVAAKILEARKFAAGVKAREAEEAAFVEQMRK